MVVQQRRHAAALAGNGAQESPGSKSPSAWHASRSSSTTPTLPADEHGTILIDHRGDIVLAVKDPSSATDTVRLRVSKAKLVQSSPYFRMLLDSTRFEEGQRVANVHESLQSQAIGDVASTTLPVIEIEDIGRISKIKSIGLLLTDFFRLLHGQDLSSSPPPLVNLANLSIVADRFDALPVLRQYSQSKRIPQLLDAKPSRTKPAMSEEKLRQRCLIALHLSHPPWLLTASQALIQRSSFPPVSDPFSQPQWADLPSSIEDELLCRRTYLLDTIQSIQTFALGQYTSRARQCKLGYDSSAACDSFQLGEMVRFFARAGTLSLAGRRVGGEDEVGFEGDVRDVIDRLRQCPEYQIDANHRHCGLRSRLVPLLDVVERALDEVGVCAECWGKDRGEYAWMQAKRPLIWKRDGPRNGMNGIRCLDRHAGVREMCMARERIWWDVASVA